jgi:hypothetical protein
VLIDCDTCTVRGQGCDDCVVTVLLGAPPGWRGSDPTVVPLTRRPGSENGRSLRPGAEAAITATGDAGGAAEASGDRGGVASARRHVPRTGPDSAVKRPPVELDDVEREAVRALADFGLVPPLRHQDASTSRDRHVS